VNAKVFSITLQRKKPDRPPLAQRDDPALYSILLRREPGVHAPKQLI